ncbi:MAG: substrate-binding domain-containing protein [Pirellulaceae bacterium]
MARCPTQAALPLVGLAAKKVIRDRHIWVGLLVVPLVLGGCAKQTETGSTAPGDGGEMAEAEGETPELLLLSGSSFIKPAQQLADEFEEETGIEIVCSTGESEELLPHVKEQQKGDIFVTHDPYLDYVEEAGSLADSVHVGFVAPVVCVSKGNEELKNKINKVEDILDIDMKLAMSDPEYSTCGEIVRDFFQSKGEWESLKEKVGNRFTKGHSRLGTLLKTEAVDCVIMWNGVANNFKDSNEIVPTPYEYEEEVKVHVMTLSYSDHQAELERYIQFVEDRGPEVFKAYGYVK